MAQVLGLIEVIWNGAKLDIEKGGTVKLGGMMQKPVIVGQQVDFANEYADSEISVTSRLRKGDSLLGIFSAGAGELQVQCDTGQSYSWSDAFLANRPEFTAGDGGKVKLKWNAGAPVELVG